MKRDTATVGFLDLLLNMLIVLFILINPPTVGETKEFPLTITISWQDGTDVDIDSYLFLPNKKMVWYSNKDMGSAHVDKDDMGSRRELMNREILIIDLLEEGEYFFSLHGYRYSQAYPGLMCFVLMEDEKGNIIRESSFPCPEKRTESPVWKFVGRDGKIVGGVRDSALLIIPFKRKR